MKPSLSRDCLHLQLYRDPKDRYKKGQTKASLSLQQFLGFESGFTLDKESNTIAIICQDVIVVLAFESRERLISWQVKVGSQLGTSKQFLVMVNNASKKLLAGPARLHLQNRRFTLTSGIPPRVLGLWELAHLRRYGVVDGKFCFEGGSRCGKGEGLHMLITDQPQDISDAFDQAALGNIISTPRSTSRNIGNEQSKSRPQTRMSDLNTQSFDHSILDSASALYEENYFGEDCGESSNFWPSNEKRSSGEHEMKEDFNIVPKAPWDGADHVTLERCSNCLSKFGAVSRSSTIAISPENTFNPEWKMENATEPQFNDLSNGSEYLNPQMLNKQESCNCHECPPDRPPKPTQFDVKKPPAPLPPTSYYSKENKKPYSFNTKVGPYENYDVPKDLLTKIERPEYYDTPKKIKKVLTDDLFQVTKSSTPGSLVLKKQCGCILKFGSKKKPVVIECDDSLRPVECPCQKVTNWANSLIGISHCNRSESSEKVTCDPTQNKNNERKALYATVDITKKSNRQSSVTEQPTSSNSDISFSNYQNLQVNEDKELDTYGNYENLEFALSLEYYENAKDLLMKAGVTKNELDALSANLNIVAEELPLLPKKIKKCTKCGHSPRPIDICQDYKNKSDEYLLMEPNKDSKVENIHPATRSISGYTPMSPNPNWSQSLKHPIHKMRRTDIEKSHSIPSLNDNITSANDGTNLCNSNKEAMQKRSSSVDSAPLVEDLKEFDSNAGSHVTSSLETLRNLVLNNRLDSPCDNDPDCYDCCKSSDSENKTSDESYLKDNIPHLRNKLMDNAQIKRSSSVPCKGGNRDSSSSNDSGVSSCSLKHGRDVPLYEMPITSGNSRYQYFTQKRLRGNLLGCLHGSLPRKSKSSDPLRDMSIQIHKANVHAKSSSAEAEVPVLPPKPFKGVMDTHSTSSGTSDMSDYIETLSLTSSQSSSDTPASAMRFSRQPMSTLRPRSGKEYHNIDPVITSMYKNGKDLANYTNLP
ncbi:uncharacterized protein LOC126973817 [Leptidea sinapis]|uniref:uncharacterized protein LOC126973817 n=1 Tax=Leptidea sinapis TaxID=189913 RepID=UPI0021C3C899|nr:uncharacterized protein LOC126973817 [Leptidea sinapis]